MLIDGDSVLVKPDIALAQMEAEKQQQTTTPAASGGAARVPGQPGDSGQPSGLFGEGTGTIVTPPAPPQLRRFYGSVPLDAMRVGRDASRIAEEIVQHLTAIVGANVEIALEIRADLPDGASEKLVRDVTENCRTLRFSHYGFEEA